MTGGEAAADPVALTDPVLLRSFVAVSDARGFTAAARRLGLRQSAVSQHVARLERRCGRRLLARDTHGVALTPDGDALLPHAREALAVGERMARYLAGVRLRGRVRLGVSEDFVSGALPDVLAAFARLHAGVDVELTVALSGQLYEGYDAGDLDLILTKRRGGKPRPLLRTGARLRPSASVFAIHRRRGINRQPVEVIGISTHGSSTLCV